MSDEELRLGDIAYGTLRGPTTMCDVARTYSYNKKDTPAMMEIEGLIRDVYTQEDGTMQGVFSESGDWIPPCALRLPESYRTPVLKTEVEAKGQRRVAVALRYNLLDASSTYSKELCPGVQERLLKLADGLEQEVEEGLHND